MILCCGEALIDMIPEPTVSGNSGFVLHSGGAVSNTAIALGRLGVRAGMLTGLSDDMFGQKLHAGLEAANVDASHVITSDRPTTLAFVHLTGGQASYSFFDENSAGRMLMPQDIPALSGDVKALFFGGISLAREPGAEAYAELLAGEGDTRVMMLDPNIRPGFIEDEPRYRARLARMIVRTDILKLSDEDLNWIAPRPGDVRDKAGALLREGPALAIVTRGSEGATGILQSGEGVTVPAGPADLVDTVGAGDTFNAGVLAKLSELALPGRDAFRAQTQTQLEDVLNFGGRVAAVTVSRAGANPPWADEL